MPSLFERHFSTNHLVRIGWSYGIKTPPYHYENGGRSTGGDRGQSRKKPSTHTLQHSRWNRCLPSEFIWMTRPLRMARFEFCHGRIVSACCPTTQFTT